MSKTGLTRVAQPTTTKATWSGGAVTVTKEYAEKFTTESEALTVAQTYISKGYNTVVSPINNGAAWQLVATAASSQLGGQDSSNVPISDVWEYQPNMVEKDFLEADISLSNGFSQAEIKAIKDAVDKTTGDAPSSFTTNQKKAFRLLAAGTRSVRVHAPLLRRTRLVRQDYSIREALTNVGSVITNILATEGVPGALLFNLPSNSNPTRTDGISMTYGWFKRAPVITQVAGGRWQIALEWEYGLWANDLYTIV